MSFPGYPDPILVHVRLNPGLGEFSNLQDAIASITDNSQTKLYQITVDPGIWYFTTPIYMKPYVLVRGSAGATVFVMIAANTDLIIGAYNTSLVDVNIGVAVPGTGRTIYYEGASNDFPQNPAFATDYEAFSINTVRFGASPFLAKIDGSAHSALLFGVNCSWGGTAAFTNGFEVVGGSLARLNLRSCVTAAATYVTLPAYMFKTYGANSNISLTACTLRNASAAGANIGLWLYDGADAHLLACDFEGWGTGIYTEALGVGPALNIAGVNLTRNTLDVLLDHPDTTGVFSGIAAHSKIVDNTVPLVPGVSNVGWGYLDNDDKQFEITSALAVTFPMGTHTDVIPLLENQGLGLISGGELSSPGGLFVSYAALRGYYVNSLGEVAFAELPGGTMPVVASTSNYLYVNTNGVVTVSGSAQDPTTTVILGRAVTTAAGVLFLDDSHTPLTPTSQNYGSIIQQIFGPLFVSGCVVSVGASPLQVSVSGGVYYVGANRYAPVGGADVVFTTTYRDNVGLGTWIEVPGVTSVPVGFYDDGSGILAPIPGGKFVKHSFYLISDHLGVTQCFMVYGQTLFDLVGDATVGVLPTPPSTFTSAMVICASFVVLSGAASIATILSERPFPTTQTSAAAPVTAHAALTGLTTGNAGHSQFMLLNGTTPMSGSLDMGTQAITNVGNVDGVDVSAHESRHVPLGSDPLPTAAPSVDVSATSTNDEGIGNSFSRSDHAHALDITSFIAQTITNGDTTHAPSGDVVFDALALKASTTHASTHLPGGSDALTTAAAGTIAVGDAAAEGAGVSFSRSDHQHALPSPAAPENVTKAAASAGVATTVARADHKHDASTAAPVTLAFGGANTEGVSTSLARADHVHQLPATPAGTVLSYSQVVGVTSGPTNNTAVYAPLAEMTVTLTPVSSTSRIDVDFTGSFSNSNNTASSLIAIFLAAGAGVALQQPNTERSGASAGTNGPTTLSTRKSFTGLTGPQTFTIQFKRSTNTTTAIGVERVMIVIETAT